jgi:hypothetical protein
MENTASNAIAAIYGALGPTNDTLVSFGNYLLSDERNKNLAYPSNRHNVTDADIQNWRLKSENNENNQ